MSTAQKDTAAIADEFQTPWMEYLHMQQPKPTNATGVKVHLTALDANGNTEEIGTVTSDVEGNFRILWTPPIEGAYTVYATFAGSESYYGSSAETSLGVSPAASAAAALVTPIPTQTPTTAITPTAAPTATIAPTPSPVVIPPTSATPITTYVAIGAAVIIIIAVAAVLTLRRRK
jgi:hypothetical protein